MAENFKQFLSTNNYIKEFNLMSSYLTQAFIPQIDELDAFMRDKLNNNNYSTWRFLRSISMQSLNDNGFFINGLKDFFLQYKILDFEKFLHNKTGQTLFEIIKNNYENIRVTQIHSDKKYFQTIKFTYGFGIIYYYNTGTYNSYDLRHFANRCSQLNQDILKIERIELLKDELWIPLVIKENGKHFICSKI